MNQTNMTWEERRRAWLEEIIRMGVLVDISYDDYDDELPEDILISDYKKLDDVNKKYKYIDKDKAEDEPKWYHDIMQFLDEEGLSPRDIQLRLIKVLSMKGSYPW